MICRAGAVREIAEEVCFLVVELLFQCNRRALEYVIVEYFECWMLLDPTYRIAPVHAEMVADEVGRKVGNNTGDDNARHSSIRLLRSQVNVSSIPNYRAQAV